MKRFLAVLVIIALFCIPVFAQSQYPKPQVREKAVIDFIEKVGVQIRIPVVQVWRSLSFYKYEKGQKLDQKVIDDMSDDEKLWYSQGYIVTYGEWIGDDLNEKDQRIQTAIYGSGSIIYSNVLPESLQSKETQLYAQTLVMTNYHVIQPLVDKLNLGTKAKPINVYEAQDIKTQIDPPSATFVEGTRPIMQKYSLLVDRKTGEPYANAWLAEGKVAGIKVKEDQNYEIEGVVIAYDKGLDVGIISIKNVSFQTYATFRDTPCVVGEKVWIRHCPMAMRFSTDRGFVNQTGLDLGVDLDGLGWNGQVKLDIPSAPGSSGSGIFDENGFLVALFHGGLIHQLGAGYSYIEGGHLAHEGVAVRDWLNWRGFSYIFNKDIGIHPDQLKVLREND